MPLEADSWLIEVGAVVASDFVPEASKELHVFNSFLAGIVHLTHVDHRVVQQGR